MKLVFPLSILLLGTLALASEPDQNRAAEAKTGSTGAAPDNSATNKRDRSATEATADQQKNDQSDVDLTARIRRSIVADKSLSTNAHNVKIIAQKGMVTLKGPVRSESEKRLVEHAATAAAGVSHVKSELEIAP
jgi:hyperosmotically inducible periplasmic protein